MHTVDEIKDKYFNGSSKQMSEAFGVRDLGNFKRDNARFIVNDEKTGVNIKRISVRGEITIAITSK